MTRTGRDGSFYDSDLEIRTSFSKNIRSAQPTGAGADNDDIALSIRVEVLEVATSHSTRDLALTDGIKGESVPFLSKVVKKLGFARELYMAVTTQRLGRHWTDGGKSLCGDWWRHDVMVSILC